MDQPRPISARLSLGTGLYCAAFLLALVLRLFGAAQLPLNNQEAGVALQALALSRGEEVILGPDAAYLALTTLLLFVFRSSDWLVRFWPALAGSLIVLLPALFQKQLGKLPAVLLAYFLAMDPGLFAVSRLAGSLPLALFFPLLAAGLWLNGYRPLAGAAFGMALLSGPAIWPGLIALAAAAWISPELRQQVMQQEEMVLFHQSPASAAHDQALPAGQPGWHSAALAALAVIFFIGTLFFNIPSGLSAMAGSLPAYLGGWVSPSGVPVLLLLVGLLVYEFLPLVLGLWGAVYGARQKEPVDRLLLVWWCVALLLALAYPARQVADLSWSLLPLWAMAARQVVRIFQMEAEDRLPILGQAVLGAIIIGFLSLNAVALANNVPGADQMVTYRIRLIGAFVMLIASTGLIAWGWTTQIALRGLLLGALAVMGVYTLSAAWDASALSSHRGRELWTGSPTVQSADLVVQTLDLLHQIAAAQPDAPAPDLAVVGVPSDALRWVLREEERVTYIDQVPSSTSPSIVITPEKPDLKLAAAYRGQSLDWVAAPGWDRIRPVEWFRWMAFRTIPADVLLKERIILWARTDLFPGDTLPAQQPLLNQPQEPVKPNEPR